METACLRIKFTPLLKQSHKSNSKCCLEIVPEVSCLQNLDKLTWRRETNYIEYTIPMTYRIILTKRDNMKNPSDKVVKTYHSCVDLLLSTSKSNHDLASGDISRIISDTFILNKLPSTIPRKRDVINITIDDRNSSDISQSRTVTNDTGTTLEIMDSTAKRLQEVVIHEDITLEAHQYNIDNEDFMSCDKLTNTDSISPLYSDAQHSASPQKFKNSPDSKRTLSLSPMCSINTQETANYLAKRIISKPVNREVRETQKELVLLGCTNTVSDLTNEAKLSSIISPIGGLSGQNSFKSVLYTSSNRSSPEIRVAQYVHYIESELLPLNMFLDELITKCSLLGVNQSQNSTISPSNKSLFYKTVYMSRNHIKTETCENTISNRAVYSVVFDG